MTRYGFLVTSLHSDPMRNFFKQHRGSEYSGYIKEHYDTRGYINSRYSSTDQNLVSRVRNLMAHAIKEQVLLPKLIVIVLDDDLIKYLDIDGYGVVKSLGRIVNNIMTELE